MLIAAANVWAATLSVAVKDLFMKKTSVISICGIITALSLVLMIIANFVPFLTYGIPAIAGALTVIIVLDIGKKYAWLVYACVSALSLILCSNELEHVFSYIMFFGFYPIIKAYIERMKSKVAQWVVKILLFTIAFSVVLVLATFVLGIPLDTMGFGIYYVIAFAIALEVMFVLYDFALTRVITLYLVAYRERFRRLMRLK